MDTPSVPIESPTAPWRAPSRPSIHPPPLPEARQVRFEDLVEFHSRYLYRYAWWLCRDRALSEDLVQDTLLRARRNLHALRSQETAKAWLTTILRREHARAFSRKRPIVDEAVEPDSFPLGEVGTQGNPVERLTLHKALNELPEKYREPLLLQVLGGFPLAEVAQILN